VAEDWRFLRMLGAQPIGAQAAISFADLDLLRAVALRLPVPDAMLRSIVDLRRELAKRQIVPSDRRFRQSLALMRGLAVVRGKTAVGDDELLFLEHVLWRDPAERETVRSVLRELVRGYDEQVQELVYQGRELGEYAQRSWDSDAQRTRARIEVEAKLRSILLQLDDIERQAREAGRDVARADAARSELESIRQTVSAMS
jgi:MoxR-like ATPase